MGILHIELYVEFVVFWNTYRFTYEMTTNEFIKILQEADPKGDSHVRLDEGFPFAAILKDGYWDGAYEYLDEKGNYVLSMRDSKVDVYCYTIEDFVEKHFKFDSTFEKEILPKLKFHLTYSTPAHNNEKKNFLIKKAREAWDINIHCEISCRESSLKKNLKRVEQGWKFFQNKEKQGTYQWKFRDENGLEHSTSYEDVIAVKTSGKWEQIENNEKEGYFEWIFKK